MAELTLEAFEERLTALESEVAELRRVESPTPLPRHNPGYTPGTGDWELFKKLAAEIRETYDFDALPAQQAVDMEDAPRQMHTSTSQEQRPGYTPGSRDWDRLRLASARLRASDYDFDAVAKQDAIDLEESRKGSQ